MPDAAAAWTPWAQSPARSPHVKVVMFFCSIVVLLSPFLVIDFTKESCSESPGSGRRGKENVGKDAKGSGGLRECLQPLPCVLSAPHCPSLIHGPSELHNMFLTYIL